MTSVRQLPMFHIRGTLASITMKNLTPEQKLESQKITIQIANHPEIKKHIRTVHSKLSKTIKADYKDDEAVTTDCIINIWKGVVLLLYHQKYTLSCGICGSNTYRSESGKDQTIYTQEKVCPSCKKSNPDGTSPIIIQSHGAKCEDPYAIINDPEQVSKFFGKYLSNSISQQLRENPTKYTTRKITMNDYADNAIIKKIEKILTKHKIKIEFYQNADGVNSIHFDTNKISLECLGQLMSVKREAESSKVGYRTLSNGIELIRQVDTQKQEITIDERTRITIRSSSQIVNADNETNNTEEQGICEEDHCEPIDSRDTLTTVIDNLPSENCKKYFQIITGTGPAYQEYVTMYGDKPPTLNKIQEMLGVSKTQIFVFKGQIISEYKRCTD